MRRRTDNYLSRSALCAEQETERNRDSASSTNATHIIVGTPPARLLSSRSRRWSLKSFNFAIECAYQVRC